MSLPLERYALIGDTHAAALVSDLGSIDWLCLPRFDSDACFAALLGEPQNGRWRIAPRGAAPATRRGYRGDSLVLETEFETSGGAVRIVDCMILREGAPQLVRLVEGLTGRVEMELELVIRFGYGAVVPWVRSEAGVLRAVAGPDGLCLRTPIATRGEGLATVAEFTVTAGTAVPFVLQWHPSHQPPPPAIDPAASVAATERWWSDWAARGVYRGPYRAAVVRSLITLKALTFRPTGAIVAAPTTSLPEQLGGSRNWDYRYCWLRDATFTLSAFSVAGYPEEAAAWRDWLLRAVAGDPEALQVVYGIGGDRRLPESELAWLPGYAGARPVRVGNAAVGQSQLDVYGELMDALHLARRHQLPSDPSDWPLQRALLGALEGKWRQPDEGIWEVRGPPRHFTHSKVMCWVAFDRAVKAVERFGLEGPVDRWRALRDEIHAEVCARSWSAARGSFVAAYGAPELDASTLLLPLVGFLPANDPRSLATLAAIERELVEEGLVRRYRSETGDDGLPPGEAAFLACSFWLADNYAAAGQLEKAQALYERLLALRNGVGLLAEEYDPRARLLLGNFPQAFSHVGLINTAFNLARAETSPAPPP